MEEQRSATTTTLFSYFPLHAIASRLPRLSIDKYWQEISWKNSMPRTFVFFFVQWPRFNKGALHFVRSTPHHLSCIFRYFLKFAICYTAAVLLNDDASLHTRAGIVRREGSPTIAETKQTQYVHIRRKASWVIYLVKNVRRMWLCHRRHSIGDERLRH